MENENKEISNRFDLPFEKLRALFFKEIVVFMLLGHFVRKGIEGVGNRFYYDESCFSTGITFLLFYWVFMWLIHLIWKKRNN
tara:strand:- start:383 stop:628 length:246 start_codon:yes stop_codon:yes gene_type:complete